MQHAPEPAHIGAQVMSVRIGLVTQLNRAWEIYLREPELMKVTIDGPRCQLLVVEESNTFFVSIGIDLFFIPCSGFCL